VQANRADKEKAERAARQAQGKLASGPGTVPRPGAAGGAGAGAGAPGAGRRAQMSMASEAQSVLARLRRA
jgi:hypothetical protein